MDYLDQKLGYESPKVTIEKEDKLAGARSQGQAQFESIKEMVDELHAAQKAYADDEDASGKLENAERRIQEDALSVEVRSGWYNPGEFGGAINAKPSEYCILLCTGGPACRIIGKLDDYGQPETAHMEVQDWFTPWTEYRPLVAEDDYDSEPIMLAYARCFWFGE